MRDLVLDRDGRLDRLNDPLPDRSTLQRVCATREKDGELVAAQPGDKMARIDEGPHALGSHAQNLIAARMPVPRR